MNKRLYALLVLCFSLALGAEDSLKGRWLFQGLSDSGRKVPLFIIEFPASGKANVLSTTAPFEVQAKDFSLEADSLTLQLLADGLPMTLKGTVANGVISGKTSGQALNGLSFIAERTEQTQLERLKPPGVEERQAFDEARSAEDPQQKIAGIRSFLGEYPDTALKTSSLLEILDAGLEADQPDDKLAAVMSEVIDSTDDKAVVMNDIAYRLAEKNRMLAKAEELARRACGLAATGSAARGNFLDTLGWVLYRQGKLEDAAGTLREALKASPREADIALHLAEVFEKQGKNLEAIEAYLQAYVGGGTRQARITARELYRKHKGSMAGFHELLDQVHAKQPPLFDPGRFEGQHSGSALVAELFTGAQCGPCQAADYAFDGLIARFPESTVNVLEYHIHVPRPDPMTTPDSMARARFYKIRSTPIALFSGTDKRPGGGPKTLAELAFQEYLDAINAQLKPGKRARVDLQVKSESDSFLVKGKIGLPESVAASDDLRLHIALVERTVHYTGSNGVHLHRNVVRKLINGSDGTRITGPEFEFTHTGSVSAIEGEIKQYLDQLAEELGTFEEAPTTLNRADLAVVAFVQNAETYQILGSAMVSLK
ncbi:MAG: tetratricopeptide repeat protein [Acidobacteriota bacterium]